MVSLDSIQNHEVRRGTRFRSLRCGAPVSTAEKFGRVRRGALQRFASGWPASFISLKFAKSRWAVNCPDVSGIGAGGKSLRRIFQFFKFGMSDLRTFF